MRARRLTLSASATLCAFVALVMSACDGAKPEVTSGGADEKAAPSPTADPKPAGADEADDAGEDGETPVEVAGAAPSDTTPDAERPSKIIRPDETTAKANRDAFITALNEGRKLSKEKMYDDAIAKFREALKLDPTHAGALGELGWAAFHKGDMATARTHTLLAIEHVKVPKRKGALLYNLGRLDEKEGKKELALEHYRRSLAVRENEVVRNKVTALESEREGPNVEVAEPITNLDSTCGLAAFGSTCSGETCGCSTEKHGKSTNANSKLAEAVVRSLAWSEEGMGNEDYYELLIKTRDRGWHSIDLVGNNSEPGVDYIHYSAEILEFQVGDLVDGGGGDEVWLVIDQRDSDGAYGDNVLEWEHYVQHYLCGHDGSKGTCVSFTSFAEGGVEKWFEDGDDPDPEIYPDLGTSKSGCKVTLGRGGVTFGRSEKKGCGVDDGTYTLDQLAKRPGANVFTFR